MQLNNSLYGGRKASPNNLNSSSTTQLSSNFKCVIQGSVNKDSSQENRYSRPSKNASIEVGLIYRQHGSKDHPQIKPFTDYNKNPQI